MKRKLKLNVGLIIIIFILIIIAIFLFSKRNSHENNIVNTSSTFVDDNSSVSFTVPDKYQFSKVASDSYLLTLISSNISSSIYVSEFPTNNIKDTLKFIEADKNDYISKFSNISEVSSISTTTVGSLPAYNYNFHYRDTMFVSVYWILKDNIFIVIDFNINTGKVDLSIIDEILNNINFN